MIHSGMGLNPAVATRVFAELNVGTPWVARRAVLPIRTQNTTRNIVD